MKKNYLLNFMILILLVSFQAIAQVDVTFRVDMSGQTVNPNGVHIAGSINGWSPNANMLTQEGATSIYSATIQLNEGWHEYKFLNGDAWGTEEAPGAPCALWGNNRIVYINNSGNDVILEPVPFNGCNADGTGFSVDFNVDMSSEPSVSGDGIHIAGWLTNWDDWKITVSDVVDGPNSIYGLSLRLPTPSNYPVVFEYKYLNGFWGTEETPDAACPTVTATNRLVTVSSSGETLMDVFNGCNYTLSVKESVFGDMQVFYANETSQLVFNQFKNLSPYKVSVYDITGKKVKTAKVDSSSKTYFDVLDMQSGLYIVKIENSQKQGVKKVMIY